MILVIDNYDSFVHNLARYIELAGQDTHIVRNDEISLDEISTMNPDAIVISPGPCTPKEAGISTEIVKQFGANTPILGVCLGHQCIAEAYGGTTLRADHPIHGKADMISHDGKDLFESLPTPMKVGRYHSLIPDFSEAEGLLITAHNEDGLPMAITHKTHPVYGVQFHPESILTEHGHALIENFITIAQAWNAKPSDIAA